MYTEFGRCEDFGVRAANEEVDGPSHGAVDGRDPPYRSGLKALSAEG